MLTSKQEGRLEKCAKLRVIDVTPTFAEALRFLFHHRGAQVLTVMATPVTVTLMMVMTLLRIHRIRPFAYVSLRPH